MEKLAGYLEDIGFHSHRPVDLSEHPRFSGILKVESLELRLELRFEKRHFDYPDAYLLDWLFDEKLRDCLGVHGIRSDGKICYIDESQAWWDSGEAIALTVGVFERIRMLITEKMSGKPSMSIVLRDFAGYWQATKAGRLSRSTNVAGNGKRYIEVVDAETGCRWLKPENYKVENGEHFFCHWVTLKLDAPANPLHSDWPPANFQQLEAWLKSLGSKSWQRLMSQLRVALCEDGKKTSPSASSRVGVMLVWPDENGEEVAVCGFTIPCDKVVMGALAGNRTKQAIVYLRRRKIAIERYSLLRADVSYIIKRNLASEDATLTKKKVVVIGAGSIGGYLLDLLCSIGAGYGNRGELHIIDPQSFEAENVGRHFLGYQSIGLTKVKELQAKLKNSYPHLTIKPHVASFDEKLHLIAAADWVIDATGSQTVAIGLSDILASVKKRPVVIHSWIQGHGLATGALIRRSEEDACYRCLWTVGESGYSPRYPLAKKQSLNEPIVVGCHNSYYPYAASIGMLAASQAVQLIQDHLSNNVRDTLRFNIVDRENCQYRTDARPRPSKHCPFCRPE